jgi:PAS domain S-box-containing protein
MRREHETARSVLESETRFRSVVESLREGLIITDLDDRILYVNPRITDLTGRRPEELAGKTAQDLLFETEGWKDADSRLAARRNQTRMRYEAPLVDRDGKVHPVQVISSPVRNPDGDVTGVVDAITDLAELQGLRSEEAGAPGA